MFVFLIPVSGLCQDDVNLRFSAGFSFINNAGALFIDYPASTESRVLNSFSMSAEYPVSDSWFIYAGGVLMGTAERLFFYSGYTDTYFMKAIYGYSGIGYKIWKGSGYTVKLGVAGYFNLFSQVDNSYGSFDTDVFSGFFPGFSLSLERELFNRFSLFFTYDGSFASVFKDIDGSRWVNLAVGMNVRI
ncbi:hypothetical protein [Desulfurobacterium sp.]